MQHIQNFAICVDEIMYLHDSTVIFYGLLNDY